MVNRPRASNRHPALHYVPGNLKPVEILKIQCSFSKNWRGEALYFFRGVYSIERSLDGIDGRFRRVKITYDVFRLDGLPLEKFIA